MPLNKQALVPPFPLNPHPPCLPTLIFRPLPLPSPQPVPPKPQCLHVCHDIFKFCNLLTYISHRVSGYNKQCANITRDVARHRQCLHIVHCCCGRHTNTHASHEDLLDRPRAACSLLSNEPPLALQLGQVPMQHLTGILSRQKIRP